MPRAASAQDPGSTHRGNRGSSSPGDGARTRPSARETGRRGEEIAARYLADTGYEVLDRNWRPGHGLRGELDAVALERRDGAPPALVAIEVKTRSGLTAGPPAAAVGREKLARLRALAAAWAAAHEEAPEHGALRIDVVSVLLRDGLPALLAHHRGVSL